jgi:phage shock protein E
VNVEGWVIAAAAGVAALVLLPRLRGGRRVPSTMVRQLIESGAQVVDVRTPQEFGGGAYPGAVNIPLQELPRRMTEIPKGKAVVVYCASGGRSAVAASMLKRAGYGEVVNAGGLSDMPR